MQNQKYKVWDKLFNKMRDMDFALKLGTEIIFGEKSQFIPLSYIEIEDKTGGEICNGDVLKVDCEEENRKIQQVVFKDGAYWGYSKKNACQYTLVANLVKMNGVKIIGNIYENPELLST